MIKNKLNLLKSEEENLYYNSEREEYIMERNMKLGCGKQIIASSLNIDKLAKTKFNAELEAKYNRMFRACQLESNNSGIEVIMVKSKKKVEEEKKSTPIMIKNIEINDENKNYKCSELVKNSTNNQIEQNVTSVAVHQESSVLNNPVDFKNVLNVNDEQKRADVQCLSSSRAVNLNSPSSELLSLRIQTDVNNNVYDNNAGYNNHEQIISKDEKVLEKKIKKCSNENRSFAFSYRNFHILEQQAQIREANHLVNHQATSYMFNAPEQQFFYPSWTSLSLNDYYFKQNQMMYPQPVYNPQILFNYPPPPAYNPRFFPNFYPEK